MIRLKNFVSFILFLFLIGNICAQISGTKLIHDLQNPQKGGKVTIVQSDDITRLIDRHLYEEGKKKRIIDKHIYHLGMCVFCGLCVKTCPSDALSFIPTFEHSVFNRNKLTKVLNKPGSTAAYRIGE